MRLQKRRFRKNASIESASRLIRRYVPVALVSAWVGMLIGSRWRELPEGLRSDYSTVVGATLTLLGLLIGFSFSMAITR